MMSQRQSLPQLLATLPNLGIPLSLIVLAAYCLMFSLGWHWWAPEGGTYVNPDFAQRAWPVLMLAAVGILTLLFVLNWVRPAQGIRAANPLPAADFLLVFLPLTPIAQYAVSNRDTLSVASTALLICVFISLIFTMSWLVPRLFTKFGLATALQIAGLTFTYTLFNMASLALSHSWFEAGSLKIQLGAMFATVGLLWVSYGAVGPRFTRVMVIVFFLANTAYGLIQAEVPQTAAMTFDGNNALVGLVGSRQPEMTPNIHLLVYDSYVANETMLAYGIDNVAQEFFLENTGFTLYPKTYSVASFTVGTMSRVFSVTTRLTGSPRSASAGNSAVHQLLRGFGYQANGVFWSDYFFQPDGSFYDQSYPELQPSHWLLSKAILCGEFRFDATYAEPDRETFLAHKKRYFATLGSSPQFTYMHVNRPNHSQNSGRCLPNETDLFRSRLAEANLEMKADIAAIMQHDPNAIIVVAGDHGPYLTKNCNSTGKHYEKSEITQLDMQDRFGTFLAIRWPSHIEVVYDDITVLQDLFPAIFATIFADQRYETAKIKPRTVRDNRSSGVAVRNGIIESGADRGRPLFAE